MILLRSRSLCGINASSSSPETGEEAYYTLEELCDPIQEQLQTCDLSFVRASQWAIQDLSDLEQYEKGVQVAQRLLAAQEGLHGKEDPKYPQIIFQLAKIRLRQERFEDAKELLEWGLTARKRILGTEHEDTTDAVTTLAHCYTSLGKFTEAGELMNNALALNDPVLGPNHAATLVDLNNLGLIYLEQRRYKPPKRSSNGPWPASKIKRIFTIINFQPA